MQTPCGSMSRACSRSRIGQWGLRKGPERSEERKKGTQRECSRYLNIKKERNARSRTRNGAMLNFPIPKV